MKVRPTPNIVRCCARRCRRGKASNNTLLFILLIAASILGYRAFTQKYDRELHAVVVKELSALLPESRVFVGSVTQNQSGTIVVSDLKLVDRRSKSKSPILEAQRIEVRGALSPADLLKNQIQVKQVDLYGLQCDAWPDENGRWNVLALTPKPKPNSTPPRIVFHNSLLRVRKSPEINAPSTTFHNLNGSIEHPRDGNTAPGTKPCLSVVRGMSTGTIRSFEIRALVDLQGHAWTVDGKVSELAYTKALQSRLPDSVTQYLSQLKDLECTASAVFRFSSPSPQQTPTFRLAGRLKSGRLQDTRLPYPLENIEAEFHCDNSRLQVRYMEASSGNTTLNLDGDIFGFGTNVPMTIHADVTNLELDERLRQSLPKSLQTQWDKLQLAGRVNGDVYLSFDGRTWTPELDVMCDQVSIRPWIFPYPVDSIRGRVRFKDGTISSERAIGLAGGQPISGRFAISKAPNAPPGVTPWIGELQCASEGPVSIDSQLVSCLTPRPDPNTRSTGPTGAEQFVSSLHPSGSIQLNYAQFRRETVDSEWNKLISAHVYSGRIQYDQFRYPIYNITGQIECKNTDWRLNQFEGRNDSGRISCSGTWTTDPQTGFVPFNLNFEARDVPLEEDLKVALPRDTQLIWDELQPQGTIDRVDVQLKREWPSPTVQTIVNINELSRENAVTGRSLKLMPRAFPYPLNDCECTIAYQPGVVEIVRASGVNGSTRIAMEGDCRPLADGRWHANVRWLPQTRLQVDKPLLSALPQSVRDSLSKIAFQGPISVLGKSGITFTNSRNGKLESTWDCQLAIEEGRLGDGKYFGKLRGTAWIQGASRGEFLEAQGSIAFDALTVLGIPVTRLNGPFSLNGSRLSFGASVYDQLPDAKGLGSQMTANALSGKIVLSGYGLLDEINRGKFHIESSLRSADLGLLLQDLGVESTTAVATCDADLDFTGIPWNSQTYSGGGSVKLRNAELYELPFMIRLMNLASVDAEESAFQSADIKFELDGDTIPLKEVVCEGEVLRLLGKGQTNLRQELDLELHAYIGRRNPIRDAIKPLFSDSRLSTVMRIQVDGTMQNPIMTPTAFPQFEETLQTMFPEVAETPQPRSYLPWRK
ncbi:MAG: AsmA-like C-terminal region-containing protein [Aureliella sp.]